MTLTPEQLRYVVPTLSTDRATNLTNIINGLLPQYGMNDADIFHEFIAQVAHESGGFRLKEENLNYTAARLVAVFPKYFPTLDKAKIFEHNPKRIANYIYNRPELGNYRPDDGYNYRGGGYIQITGKAIYQAYADYIGMPVLDTAVLVRTNDHYALDSAMWVFAVNKKLIQAAKDDKFEYITRRINGALIGFSDRVKYYDRAKAIIK